MGALRYILRLSTDGAEVWKRYTGDRDEAATMGARALVDMGVREQPGLMFMAILAPDFTMGKGVDSIESAVLSNDFRSRLTLEVKRKGKTESTS